MYVYMATGTYLGVEGIGEQRDHVVWAKSHTANTIQVSNTRMQQGNMGTLCSAVPLRDPVALLPS